MSSNHLDSLAVTRVGTARDDGLRSPARQFPDLGIPDFVVVDAREQSGRRREVVEGLGLEQGQVVEGRYLNGWIGQPHRLLEALM